MHLINSPVKISLVVVFISLFAAAGVFACCYEPPPPPPPNPGCTIDATGVVGNLPFNTPADYAPGLEAQGVTINAGNYVVGGVATADNGDKFYRIVVSCQFLYVPTGSMQPSFDAPQNGEPLPTNEVS